MKCELCDVSVKDENLRRHYATTHPGEELPKQTPPTKRPPRQPLTRKSKKLITALVVILGLATLLVWHGPIGIAPPDTECINHSGGFAYHWHSQLNIYVDGQPYTIPANIGISSTCMRSVHTHDTSGLLHIESPSSDKLLTLGYLFQEWGKPFGSPEISLDGQPSSAGASLVLRDGQTIDLSYTDF